MNPKELENLLDIAIETKADREKQKFHSALYQFYFEIIYVIVYKRFPKDAEDIIQSIFYKLLKLNLEKVKMILGHLDAYIIKIVLNFCNDELKRQVKKSMDSLDDGDYYKNTIPASNVSDTSWNIKLDVLQAIENIPERQRKAFLLHIEGGYKHKEIPKLLEEAISPGASKQLVIRAKENLKNQLANSYS